MTARRVKLLSLLAFNCLWLSLVVEILTAEPSGYEISIYNAFPWYFWLLILTAFAAGVVILVGQAFSSRTSAYWTLGYLAILISNGLILLLPFLRGYATSRAADVLSHIGYTVDIITSGHLSLAGAPGENPYPAVHFILAGVYYVTGIGIETLVIIIPVAFTMYYMISIHVLSRAISRSFGSSLLITAFGSVLLFRDQNMLLFPSMQAFQMLPITLFTYYRSKELETASIGYSACLLLLLIATPLINPGEGTLFLALIIVIATLADRTYLRKWPASLSQGRQNAKAITSPLNPTLILGVSWFLWFSSFAAFGTIRVIVRWFVYGIGTVTAIQYAQLLGRANLGPIQFLSLLVSSFGQVILYLLVASVLSVHSWRAFLSYRRDLNPRQFAFSTLFPVFFALLLVTFFTNIWLNFEREMRYAIFAATILGGIGLYSISHQSLKRILPMCVALLILAAGVTGTFNTFPSPIDRSANYQVTQMELTGMSWFLSHRDTRTQIYQLGLPVARFAQALLGVSETQPGILNDTELKPPDHFGYGTNGSFSNSVDYPSYFVDSKLTRVFSPSVNPEYESIWKFTPSDFDRLDNKDFGVDTIYSDGEFWVYYVFPENSRP